MYINKTDKILFFSSGDFAIPTFSQMLSDGYNIVGLVTSNDKCYFNHKTLKNYADEHNIPTIIVGKEGLLDNTNLEFIKKVNADIFCVISFKFLPNEIIKYAKKTAFNVHASLLPYLKGAAPINWAIRLGFQETGLTSFLLTDKIDSGNILSMVTEKIDIGIDDYQTLFMRLSNKCVSFTKNVIDNILSKDDFKERALPQYHKDFISQRLIDSRLWRAPKINRKYFEDIYNICDSRWSGTTLNWLMKSVYPIEGLPSVILVTDKERNTVKIISCKIFDIKAEDIMYHYPYYNNYRDFSTNLFTDGKSYLKIRGFDEEQESWIYINEIQLEGKKRLNIKEFLKGFQYLKNNEKYNVKLYLLDYKDRISLITFEAYIKKVKELLCCNMTTDTDRNEICFNYTEQQIDNNLNYFKNCHKENISAYKALTLFTDLTN